MEEKNTEGTMYTEEKEFLHLRSIVLLNGSVKKFMILARGALANIKGRQRFSTMGSVSTWRA